MQHIYIQPVFTPLLCILLVYASMALYLLLWKPRTRASLWLGALNLGMVLSVVGWSVGKVVPFSMMDTAMQHTASRLGILGFSVQVLSMVQFAYHYRRNFSARESVMVLIGCGIVTTFFMIASFLNPSAVMLRIVSLSYFLGGLGWAVVILLRKTVRLSKGVSAGPVSVMGHLLQPQGMEALSCRAFGGLSFLFLVLFIYQLLVWFIPNTLGLSYALAPLLSMATMFWMFIAFTNDLSQRAGILVKLVGTMQMVVMTLLVVISISFFGPAWVDKTADLTPLQKKTIRFEPVADEPNAYLQRSIPFVWRDVEGDEIPLEDESDQVVRFDFSFPFYGSNWHDGYLNSNGVLSFGAHIRTPGLMPVYEPSRFYLSEAPKIAILYADLDPSRGTVRVSPGSKEFVITWEDVPRFQAGRGEGIDMQMALMADGTIELSYRSGPSSTGLETISSSGLIGIHPGENAGEATALTFRPAMEVRGASMGPVVEDRFLQVARAIHPVGKRLALITVFSFLLGMVVYPWLLRGSLLLPLRRLLVGVNRVQQGELDVHVVPSSGDDIGILTDHFNEMTASVRTANQTLQEYAETLESKVEERTQALQKSLEDLQRAQQQLVQSEKMASLGQLTAGIAHEIKNPLNFVNNFADLSRELVAEIEEEAVQYQDELPHGFWKELHPLLQDLEKHQEKIVKHGRRADGIVQSMLAHARNTPGESRCVKLNPFADEFVGLAYHGMRSADSGFNVAIERDYAGCVDEVELMPQEMGQVLVNLLNNALYAVKERSKKEQAGYTPCIRIATRCEGDWIRLSIADNGIGIAPHLVDRVFEPFYTTKPAGSGTGLGLSLSYDIVVKSHAGQLEVESTEGEGSVFTISLPVSKPRPVTVASSAPQ